MNNTPFRLLFFIVTVAAASGLNGAHAQTHPSHPATKQTEHSHAPAKKKDKPNSEASGDSTKLGDVRVAGVRLSGLEPAQARWKLTQALRGKLNTRVRITDGVKSVSVPRNSLGIALNTEEMVGEAKQGKKAVSLKFSVDREKLQKALRKAAPRFESAGRNARPVVQHGHIHIVRGEDSRTVNVGKSTETLAARIEKSPTVGTLPLILEKKSPKFNVAQLKGITARLSQFSTRYSTSNAKRSHNIRTAVKTIDGTVLQPGETFSLNKTVGERTHEHGFLTAPVIEKQKLTEGIGGGVSQVTGTLFNAALLAGLPIVEYGTHSEPVPYIPIGRDATVAWEHIDLRFKNSTQAPVYIEYKAQNGRCTAAIYGASQPGRQISLSVASKKLGPHHMTAELYRVFKKSGKPVRKEKIGHSEYNWKPKQGSE